jgi:predicted transcriptional regulator
MDLKQSLSDDLILQLTDEQVAEIASSKKEIEEGLFVDNRTFKKEVKTWLKER